MYLHMASLALQIPHVGRTASHLILRSRQAWHAVFLRVLVVLIGMLLLEDSRLRFVWGSSASSPLLRAIEARGESDGTCSRGSVFWERVFIHPHRWIACREKAGDTFSHDRCKLCRYAIC